MENGSSKGAILVLPSPPFFVAHVPIIWHAILIEGRARMKRERGNARRRVISRGETRPEIQGA